MDDVDRWCYRRLGVSDMTWEDFGILTDMDETGKSGQREQIGDGDKGVTLRPPDQSDERMICLLRTAYDLCAMTDVQGPI